MLCLDLVVQLDRSPSIEVSADVCGKLMIELESLQKASSIKESSLAVPIHETGIRLWNVVIAKKTGKKMNRLSIAQGINDHFAGLVVRGVR